MLNAFPQKQSGFTLIELLIGFVIIGILMAFAAPSFRTWLLNTQIRNAAESITNGLQRARAEAVVRNADVEFVLEAGSSWKVRVFGGDQIESRSGNEGSRHVSVTALAGDFTAATTIRYNALGEVVSAANSLARIDLDAPGGDRNLRILIGLGGNARMCDPSLSPGSGPRAC